MFCKADKMRLWLAFSRDTENIKLSLAASGALAMVSEIPEVASAMIAAKSIETFQSLARSNERELQHRAAYTLSRLVQYPEVYQDKTVLSKILAELHNLLQSPDASISSEAKSGITFVSSLQQ